MVQCVNCEFRCTGAGAFHSGFVRDRVGELEPPPTKELEQSSSTTNTKIRVSNGKNFYSNFLWHEYGQLSLSWQLYINIFVLMYHSVLFRSKMHCKYLRGNKNTHIILVKRHVEKRSVLCVFFFFFGVSLTVHLSITLANDQLDAQIFHTFITILYMYMFRAISCSSSGGQIVLTL